MTAADVKARRLPTTNGSGPPRKGPGRPKGVPNKITQDIKAAILESFNELGGKDFLVQVGRENPTVYCALLGKLLPHTLQGPNGKAIEIVEIRSFVAEPVAAAMTIEIEKAAE